LTSFLSALLDIDPRLSRIKGDKHLSKLRVSIQRALGIKVMVREMISA
jgi:hypothetical protein